MNLSTRPESSRAWVEVNLANLAANTRKIQAANPNAKLLPMVKANAYGVGVMEVVPTLESLDPWGYGVATVGEGIELRQIGIARPIVVFTPALADQLDDYRRYDLRPVLDQPALIAMWTAAFHLEIDTGMRRGGIPWNDVAGIAAALQRKPEGIFTHLHSADTNASSVTQQLERFNDALQRCGLFVDSGIATSRTGEQTALVHVANSAGSLRRLNDRHALVRPGIFLYGGRVGEDQPMPEPVVSVRARVVSIRSLERGDSVSYGADWTAPHSTRVATVSIGYADGIRRSIQGRAFTLVHGRRCPIVGRVTMDMTLVDVGPDADLHVAPGDVVTLVGRDGEAVITLDEFATWAGTISYEVLTGLSPRLPRVYHREGS